MATSKGKPEAKSPRFHDYLNGLQEEFERQCNPTSTQNIRFNIYVVGLRGEYELLAGEIESLRKERDECKANVKVQVKEHRRSILCDRCGKGAASSQGNSIMTTLLKPFVGLSAADTSQDVGPTQETMTPQPSQWFTPPPSLPDSNLSFTPRPKFGTLFSNLPHTSISTSYPTSESGSDSEQGRPSITFNKEVEKFEFDVEMVHALPHEESLFYVNFSQDGKFLAAGGHDGKVYIYGVQTGTLNCVLRDLITEDDILITSVCFNHSGEYLATATSDGDIFIWEIKTKYVRNAFKGHTNWIGSLRFSPNGRQLVSVSDDNTARLWSMRDGTSIILTDTPNFVAIDGSYYTAAVFSPDGRYIVASHRDGVVRIWNTRTCQLMRRMTVVHTGSVNDIAFMPDGQGLVTGDTDMPLKYWDVSSLDTTFRTRPTITSDLHGRLSGVWKQTLPGREFLGCHKASVLSLAISGDGRWVAASSVDNSVRIWDTRNGAMQCTLNNDEKMWTIDFSPLGRYLASGGNSGTVKIWRYSESYNTPEA